MKKSVQSKLRNALLQEAKWMVERGDSLDPIQSSLLKEHLILQKRRLKKLQLQGREMLSDIQKREYDELVKEVERFDF